MEGIVFDIQRFCLHDGPGIRTGVFLKGCMMHCIWCHNPESLSRKIQLSYDASKCIGCRECEMVCQSGVHSFDEENHWVQYETCAGCGQCIPRCPTGSLKLFGKRMSAEDVMEEINRVVIKEPVGRGDVVIADVLGLGVDVIATSSLLRYLKEEEKI